MDEELNIRTIEIPSANVSRTITSDIAKVIAKHLYIDDGNLMCCLLNLNAEASNTANRDFNLNNVPKAGKHANNPYWLAQISEILLKRTNPQSVPDCTRDLDAFWPQVDNNVEILQKLKLYSSTAPLFDLMISLAKDLKAGALFILKKFALAKRMATAYSNYLTLHERLSRVPSQLLLNEVHRNEALDISKSSMDAHNVMQTHFKTFAKSLPSAGEINGYQLLLGISYKNVSFLEILELYDLSDCDLGAYCARLPVPPNSDKHIKELYDSDIKVLTLIQSHTRTENESKISLKNETDALLDNLRKFFFEVGRMSELSSIPKIKTLRSQLEDYLKSYLKLQSKDRNLFNEGLTFTNEDDEILERVDILQYVNKYLTKLHSLEESILEKRKKDEEAKKNARDNLARSLPKGEFCEFRSPSDALHWVAEFDQKITAFEPFPEMLPHFCSQLKASFKSEKDKKLVSFYTTPSEYRNYVFSNYISNGVVVNSTLDDVLRLPNPTLEKDSLRNINKTMKILELFISNKLKYYISDDLLDRLLVKCFIPKHREEFLSAWSMKLLTLKQATPTGLLSRVNLAPEIGGVFGHLATSRHPPGTREPSVAFSDASGAESITSKNLEQTLQERRNFFYTFLVQKYQQIQYTLVSSKKLESLASAKKDTHRDKREYKDKAMVSNSYVRKGSPRTKKPFKKPQSKLGNLKNCPIKCKEGKHKEGSLYFCKTFRKKPLKEKIELLNKIRICRTCLQPQHIGPNKHIDSSLCDHSGMKCMFCNGNHNPIICPKSNATEKSNVSVTVPDEREITSDEDSYLGSDESESDQASESFSDNELREEEESDEEEYDKALHCKLCERDYEGDYEGSDDE